ncbi:MAG: hypothetical protein DBX59_11090 [Bacillota bacterium]|nr:MAG: hypothetical protein DBX59_11090 [Bacillota bacterium]
MKKAYRFGYNLYFKDEAFAENLKFVKKNNDIIDEITLFVEYSHHGYWPLEWQKKSSAVMKDRMEQYRAAGVKSVGVNVLATIGHIDEGFDVLPKPPMQTMVGDDGSVSRSCMCINTEEYLEYITERYKLVARSGPAFIWIDDDFRIPRHGVANPCFCPKCVADFSAEYGRKFDRESLVAAINADEKVKKAFDAFRISKFDFVAGKIEEAIHSVDPSIKTGFMTSPEWSEVEWLNRFKATMGRPGGGFYHDDRPNDVIRKGFDVGKQIALFPEYIEDIQYEFENFPYQEFAKSQTLIKTECALSLMYGCNGVLYNAFIGSYQRLMDTVRSRAAQWDKIVTYSHKGKNKGVYGNQNACLAFGEIGVPLAARAEDACALILCGGNVRAMDDEEILNALKGGVMLDGEAFYELSSRGFACYCGVEIENAYNNGMSERFTDSRFNGQYAGYKRDVYMNFWDCYKDKDVYTYRPQAGCEVISNLENINHEMKGPSCTVYENELGGRVCVMGNFFPEFCKCREKQSQIMNVLDFLAGGMPAKAYGDCRTHLVCRESEENALLCAMNCSMDADVNLYAEIKGDYKKISLIAADGSLCAADAERTANGVKITLKNPAPWDYALVLCEK